MTLDTQEMDRMAEGVHHAIARRNATKKAAEDAQEDLMRRWGALHSYAAARVPIGRNAKRTVEESMTRAKAKLDALAAEART